MVSGKENARRLGGGLGIFVAAFGIAKQVALGILAMLGATMELGAAFGAKPYRRRWSAFYCKTSLISFSAHSDLARFNLHKTYHAKTHTGLEVE